MLRVTAKGGDRHVIVDFKFVMGHTPVRKNCLLDLHITDVFGHVYSESEYVGIYEHAFRPV